MPEAEHPEQKTMTPDEYRAWLRSLAPKREDFSDEDSYEEALAGYRHRVGPLLRPPPDKT